MNSTRFALLAFLTMVPATVLAQDDGRGVLTQTLVHADSKFDVVADPASIKLEVDSHPARLMSFVPVKPSGVQIALLIDDGLSRTAGVQLEDLKKFAATLPPGVELLVGYMQNGRVEVLSPFSADHAIAAATLRVPMGIAGQSASPYFCLSDFVKHWPGADEGEVVPRARVVMMLTNGVDPYYGSTSPLNQDSPYVAAAVTDAQRAGVAVYSIYYRDAGFGGSGSASFSGQSYLQQVAQATGGESYYEGSGNPVSLAPFLQQFTHAVAETYIATFTASAVGSGHEHLVRLKMSTATPKLKLRHAEQVRPGNLEGGTAVQSSR